MMYLMNSPHCQHNIMYSYRNCTLREKNGVLWLGEGLSMLFQEVLVLHSALPDGTLKVLI